MIPSRTLSGVLTGIFVGMATELGEGNPETEAEILELLPFEPRRLPHAELVEELATTALAYVKTGECSAFASVALVAGVSYYGEAVAHRDELRRTAVGG